MKIFKVLSFFKYRPHYLKIEKDSTICILRSGTYGEKLRIDQEKLNTKIFVSFSCEFCPKNSHKCLMIKITIKCFFLDFINKLFT